MPRGDLGAREDDQAVCVTVFLQEGRDRAAVGVMQDLDPDPLKLLLMGRSGQQVVGYERDVMSPAADRAEHLQHSHRAGVTVWREHAMIDHQNLPARIMDPGRGDGRSGREPDRGWDGGASRSASGRGTWTD